MKVLHLISSGGMYGAEAVILNLSQTLKERGHQNVLGVFGSATQPNHELLERAAAASLEIHTIVCRGQLDPSVPTALSRLRQQTEADVVHAHGYKADVYAWAGLRYQLPLVSTCHTWYDNDLAVRLYGALDRVVLGRYHAVIAVSAEVRERLLRSGVRAKRIHLIRNGIDLRPYAPGADRRLRQTPPAGLCVGLVGRLAHEKGVDLFLRAAAVVHSVMPNARFVIMGEGPDRAELERLLEELGLAGIASMPGRAEDMPAVYAGLDLLVSASRQEGLPIALLEGMSSGLALVATAVGEVPTLLSGGATGLEVPPNDVAALAEAILTLLSDDALRRRLGEAGRALIAKDFSVERMAGEYLAVYGAAIASAGARKSHP